MESTLTAENYVLKFGKYRGMRAADVADIFVVDKKGEDKPVGLQYLKWLVNQDWFKHTDIIQPIIKETEEAMGIKEEIKPAEEEKQKKVKKEKEPKKERKKDKKVTKGVDISNEKTVLEFD